MPVWEDEEGRKCVGFGVVFFLYGLGVGWGFVNVRSGCGITILEQLYEFFFSR